MYCKISFMCNSQSLVEIVVRNYKLEVAKTPGFESLSSRNEDVYLLLHYFSKDEEG